MVLFIGLMVRNYEMVQLRNTFFISFFYLSESQLILPLQIKDLDSLCYYFHTKLEATIIPFVLQYAESCSLLSF